MIEISGVASLVEACLSLPEHLELKNKAGKLTEGVPEFYSPI